MLEYYLRGIFLVLWEKRGNRVVSSIGVGCELGWDRRRVFKFFVDKYFSY